MNKTNIISGIGALGSPYGSCLLTIGLLGLLFIVIYVLLKDDKKEIKLVDGKKIDKSIEDTSNLIIIIAGFIGLFNYIMGLIK